MKKSLVLLFFRVMALGLLPGLVQAQWGGDYLGTTTIDSGNNDIVVQSFRTSVPAVSIQNRSDKPLRCSANFSNGAQFSETRSTTIAPGKRAALAYGVRYITSRVDIQVACSERLHG
ncbi:hypothetical protein [Glaciimonas sp. PCH181]|uniref:hypothetical protein n=1 Tax=Glaciimonas sp. PCH181 TaxID=2133943 RepID=UPI000D3C8355|nr:hypothetical protein [Glaciimonas sp. PCH181]PUA16925.1 hypothetical protein C7W93_13145 [Glaciimonas sp. PCH181]